MRYSHVLPENSHIPQSNEVAKKIYRKLRYREMFIVNDAVRLVPSKYQVRVEPTVNVAMAKTLESNPFDFIRSIFR